MEPEVANQIEEGLASEAYERVKGDLALLDLDKLLPFNVDVPTAVTTILGALPRLKAMRGRFEEYLPKFDLSAFDKLEDYAWALSHAQTLYLMVGRPPDDLDELFAEAVKLRERLLANVRALVSQELLFQQRIDILRGRNGYNNTAQDLQLLAEAMRERWEQIRGATAVTEEDLERALRLAARLMRVVGVRKRRPRLLAEATERRLRAFTLLLTTYEDTRHAVRYLCRDPAKAAEVAPTLYPGKSRRKRARGERRSALLSMPASAESPFQDGSAPALNGNASPAPTLSGNIAASSAPWATAGWCVFVREVPPEQSSGRIAVPLLPWRVPSDTT